MGFRILEYVIQRRKLVLWITLVFFVVTSIYAIFMDPKYETSVLLLPPVEESGGSMLTAWMAQLNLPSMVIPMTAGAMSAAILADILLSYRLAEMTVEALDLMEWYDIETMEETVRELHGRMSVLATETGMIRMSVNDRDPRKAVDIALFLISGLDSLNHSLQFSRADFTMKFIEGQIRDYRGRLERIGLEIADFQQKHGIIDFDEQVRGAIDVAADLKVRAVLAEIEYDLLKEFAREDARELKRKEAEYKNLTEQLKAIMEGDGSESVFVPLGDMPVLHQDYASLQRELTVNSKVYSFLLERYEESGITRARNTPTIQVVDKPHIPEKTSGIPRWGIVLLATLVGLLWSSVTIGWWGWLSSKERSEEDDKAFREVVELSKRDVEKIRKWLRL